VIDLRVFCEPQTLAAFSLPEVSCDALAGVGCLSFLLHMQRERPEQGYLAAGLPNRPVIGPHVDSPGVRYESADFSRLENWSHWRTGPD